MTEPAPAMAHQILQPVSRESECSHFRAVTFPARIPGEFGLEDTVNPLFDVLQLGFALGVPDLVAELVERLEHALGTGAGAREAPRSNDDRDQRSQQQRCVVELVVVFIEKALLVSV